MKKKILSFTALLSALNVQAGDYAYLTFETTDGAKASVEVSASLALTISGNTLTAGSQTFTLENLCKMYFTASDETATGIETLSAATLDDEAEIFDLQGHKVTKDQMHKGVYIVKTNTRTHKIIVR